MNGQKDYKKKCNAILKKGTNSWPKNIDGAYKIKIWETFVNSLRLYFLYWILNTMGTRVTTTSLFPTLFIKVERIYKSSIFHSCLRLKFFLMDKRL